MKKVLLLSALVLTIVASMVSGTLAVYQRTLTPYDNDVVAKDFVLVSEGTVNFDADVKIAPDEDVTMTFTVSNNDAGIRTEVPMDLTITVTFSGALPIEPLTATITGGSSSFAVTGSLTDGVGDFDITDALGATADETLTYEIAISWPDGGATDINYVDSITNVSVSVTGTQS